MTATIIDGKQFAEKISLQIAEQTKNLVITPTLAVILVGNDPASEIYVNRKYKAFYNSGMNTLNIHLGTQVNENLLIQEIMELNDNPSVHGILVQLPLPKHINVSRVLNTIDPKKDVDGFHPTNVGLLSIGTPNLVPCTPLGCLWLLQDVHKNLTGKHVVIIGRSNIVGKPLAQLLLNANCTVTITHSKTQNLPEICKQADIVVAALGSPRFVQTEWIKPGATILDVGINRVDRKLVGDVDFETVAQVAEYITPVPGGIGPITISCLLYNTLKAYKNQIGL